MDGIFVINKATGMTSHDVVARVRKLLKQKRVGHAGTLDPAASGVLPICVGLGTRVAEYLSESGKAYRAEILFGVVTDTYDAEGSVLRSADATGLTREQIEAILPDFTGPQMQRPPRYSAIKIQGRRAYSLARSGEEVELEPRPVEISRLEIIDWTNPRLVLDIECSKGTYIRSLAYDLGERIGTGAHLAALQRTRSGPFTLAESVTLEQLAVAIDNKTLDEYILPVDAAIQHLLELRLDETTARGVLHGTSFSYQGLPTQPMGSLARMVDSSGQFLGIAVWDGERDRWQPKKVFLKDHHETGPHGL